MKIQNFEKINARIRQQFKQLKKDHPERLKKRLNLSWSNWVFGMESLYASVKRLADIDIKYIELHGNHYGPNIGYKAAEIEKITELTNIQVAGICGMFSADNDLSSISGIQRQNAIDYIRRELDFASAVGADYILIVPGAVGRPIPYDDFEFDRSINTLQLVGDLFCEKKIKAVIEPICSYEVSFCHTIDDAKKYIKAIDHPWIQYINGDVYHMQIEEIHIAQAILDAGQMLINLHIADSNRRALGDGSLDIDTIIMALYIIGNNKEGCYVTLEPIGPGCNPYKLIYSKYDSGPLNELVNKSITYFRKRENFLLEEL
jgi:D-psicose/D-tagatose/L-ribulose 3-epimerase